MTTPTKQELQQRLEAFEKWTAALRSGNYRQCRDMLSDGTGYCCLAVQCIVAGIPESEDGAFEGVKDVLPDSQQQALGITEVGDLSAPVCIPDTGDEFQCLSELNDNGLGFMDIADIIEDEWINSLRKQLEDME